MIGFNIFWFWLWYLITNNTDNTFDEGKYLVCKTYQYFIAQNTCFMQFILNKQQEKKYKECCIVNAKYQVLYLDPSKKFESYNDGY